MCKLVVASTTAIEARSSRVVRNCSCETALRAASRLLRARIISVLSRDSGVMARS
jgi:hypothetical protein